MLLFCLEKTPTNPPPQISYTMDEAALDDSEPNAREELHPDTHETNPEAEIPNNTVESAARSSALKSGTPRALAEQEARFRKNDESTPSVLDGPDRALLNRAKALAAAASNRSSAWTTACPESKEC